MEGNLKYRRVLLKLSGESLNAAQALGYDPEAVRDIAARLAATVDGGLELAIVIGAGNLWRGAVGAKLGMERNTADYMGMLGTVMNALCLKQALEQAGVGCEVMTAIPMHPIAEPFSHSKAIAYLEEGRVVIFAAGTGHPFFTTDTTAALRALEIGAEAVLKATKVDGVYTDDPKKNPDARRYATLSFDEALDKRLKVMDATAFSLCRDNDLPIVVFDFSDPTSLDRVLAGDSSAATVVSNSAEPTE